jgi:hypothetical protein
MPNRETAATQIREVVSWVAAYISEQRELFHHKAQPIDHSRLRSLQPFFASELVAHTRVTHGSADEPSFYPQLRTMGFSNLPRFTGTSGITFIDVIVHSEPLTDSLLFHELVHVVQYRRFGLLGFADRYVRGFLSGGSYEDIPLEKQAYELEGQFLNNRAQPFSVEHDVERRIQNGLL